MLTPHLRRARGAHLIAIGVAHGARRWIHAHVAVGVDEAGGHDLAAGVDNDCTSRSHAVAVPHRRDEAVHQQHMPPFKHRSRCRHHPRPPQ